MDGVPAVANAVVVPLAVMLIAAAIAPIVSAVVEGAAEYADIGAAVDVACVGGGKPDES